MIIPAGQFDALIMSGLDTPDDAPALREAFARPRRFVRDDGTIPTPGHVSVEMTDDPGRGLVLGRRQ